MKKIVFATVLIMSLGACQTANSLRGAGTNGAMAAVSCAQIYNTFEAYKRDKQSMELLAQIGGVTNTDISNATPETAAAYYENAVLSANIALAVQGCQPITP